MRRLAICLGLLALGACASEPQDGSPAEAGADPTRHTGQTLVYECGMGEDFIIRTGPGEVALWTEDRYLVLSQVRSGSGSKFQEGDVVFWSKGEEAMLDMGDVRYRDCRPNPRRVPWEDARRRGVDLRAVGNEPGWHVEVREGDSILFVADYGASKYLFRDFSGSREQGERRYSAADGQRQLSITALETTCADSMSGERFPLQVEVSLDGRHYLGCGMLLDHPWE